MLPCSSLAVPEMPTFAGVHGGPAVGFARQELLACPVLPHRLVMWGKLDAVSALEGLIRQCKWMRHPLEDTTGTPHVDAHEGGHRSITGVPSVRHLGRPWMKSLGEPAWLCQGRAFPGCLHTRAAGHACGVWGFRGGGSNQAMPGHGPQQGLALPKGWARIVHCPWAAGELKDAPLVPIRVPNGRRTHWRDAGSAALTGSSPTVLPALGNGAGNAPLGQVAILHRPMGEPVGLEPTTFSLAA